MNMFDQETSRKSPTLYKPFDASTLPTRDEVVKKISDHVEMLLIDMTDPESSKRTEAESTYDRLGIKFRKQVSSDDSYVQEGNSYHVIPECLITHQLKDTEYQMRNIHRVEELTKLLAHNFDIDMKGTFSGRSNGTRIIECVKYLSMDAERLSTVNNFNSEDLNTVHLAPILQALSKQSGKEFSSICNTVVTILSDQVRLDVLNAYLRELRSEGSVLISI